MMIADAMKPFGMSLLRFFEGDSSATLTVRRNDGFEARLPVEHFFRSETEFTNIEKNAIDLCKGRVLDIGAGTGIHSLVIGSKGLPVTALDITSEAVEIMRQRGIENSIRGDVFDFNGGPFDTLFMMGHGIGIVGDLEGLSKFLEHIENLIGSEGQLILDSLDVSHSKEPKDLEYHARNRKEGRYIGEITMQFQFQENIGPYCNWLHIDQETLSEIAGNNGWNSEIILDNEHGEYLARLQRNYAV